jgi:DNA-binding NtrC family response regulator
MEVLVGRLEVKRLPMSDLLVLTMVTTVLGMQNQEMATQKKHILVVDDDVQLTQILKEMFELHDYEASMAVDGVQALKLVMGEKVDVILCDLNIPQLAGDMFYTAIGRVQPKLQKRFVFITGDADNPKYAEFLQRVKAPVLSKPASFSAILSEINSVLSQPVSWEFKNA